MSDKKNYRRNKKINKSNIRNGQKDKKSLQEFNDEFISPYQLSSGDFDRHQSKEFHNSLTEKDLEYEETKLNEKDLEYTETKLNEKDLEYIDTKSNDEYEKYDDDYFNPIQFKKD